MNKKKKIIFFELNEVPLRIFEDSFNYLNYKTKKQDYEFIPTFSHDECHLSPWTTWATVHRGVTYEKHKIGDLGQNCKDIDKQYPPIWSLLLNQGLRVGVFGSLHSSQTPVETYKKYSFYIPDVFSAHPQCNPKRYLGVQSLNLFLSRRSARIVESRFFPPIKRLFGAMYSYTISSFSISTVYRIFYQLVNEKLYPWKNIRRRIIQSDILFDGFFTLLKKTKPDFCTFFTNHVASSMHRFWEATYPEDYKTIIHDQIWIDRYKKEIPKAMESTCNYINKLTDFVNKNPEYELWILSSMGQEASGKYKPQKQFWLITNLKKFLQNIVGEEIFIKDAPSMIPLYSVQTDEETVKKIEKSFSQISSNANLKLRTKTKDTLSFYFYSNETNIFIKKGEEFKNLDGLSLKQIDENTSSSAYHVPEGTFFRYGKNLSKINKKYFFNGFLPTDRIKNIIIKNFK